MKTVTDQQDQKEQYFKMALNSYNNFILRTL